MIVDLKVPVEIIQHETPRQFCSEFATFLFFFFAKDLANDFNMRPPAKDKRGVHERFAKVLTYMYIYIYMYNQD